MPDGLSNLLLAQVNQSVAEQMGLNFPRDRWPDLERGIQAAATKLGHKDAESCARWMLSAPLTRKGMEVVAGELTIGETYFLREKRSLEIVSEQILPEIVRLREKTGRHLRIWSAGCCTGEEPYSIAILLDRLLPDFKEWQVTILGTDINPVSLQKAAKGIYSEWSFRDAPPWLKANYFKQIDGNHYEIAARIKKRVTFASLNLADNSYPSLATQTNAMDLIFCRNVLMYFTPERMKETVRRFQRTLVEGGWLIVSPTETSSEIFAPFSPVYFEGALLYRKENNPPVPAKTFVSAEEPVFSFRALESFPPPPHLDLPAALPIEISPPPAPREEKIEADAHREALVLFEHGHYAEAAEKLGKESQSPAMTAESAALMARIWANLGDLSAARTWAEQALGQDKLNAEWHYLRAVILQEQGLLEEGMATFKRVLYLDPRFVLAHFSLGHLALRQGNFKEADKYFINVLGLLADYQPEDLLSQSDGLVAGRLREMVEATMAMERSS